MDKLSDLWWSRVQSFWMDALKYLKIIITGYAYLPMVFLLLLGWLYKTFLQWLPKDYPIGWIIAVILTLLLTQSSLRTFLKKADLVFLLPVESLLRSYFLRSYVYSLIVQSIGMTIILFLIAPLYTLRVSSAAADFYLLLFSGLVLKAWNLYMAWQEQKWVDSRQRLIITLVRVLHNALWSLLLVGIGNIWVPLIFTVVLSTLMVKVSPNGYNWIRLIELEEQHKSTFYSFAQWFMDIPQLSRKVGKRTPLLFLLKWIPYRSRWAYTYLFIRSVLRYSDLFYSYVRLVFVGCFLLLFVQQFYLSVLLSGFFLLMNTIQLANGWNRLKYHFWYHVYPLPPSYRRVGFIQTIVALLGFQLIVSLGAYLSQYTLGTALLLVLVGFVLSLLFMAVLLPKVVKKETY